MTALEKFRASNAWDKLYDLPLCPQLNNPFFYLALADIVIADADGVGLNRDRILKHFILCEDIESVGKWDVETPGLFHRWPDESGGNTSHDEVMGAASLHPVIAERLLNYLDSTDGDFNNQRLTPKYPEAFNLYRFIWLRPFLQACAGRKVSLISQIIWSACVFEDAFYPADSSGKLKKFLMFRKMDSLPICKPVIKFWLRKQADLGVTWKSCLAKEPKEYPVYFEEAK